MEDLREIQTSAYWEAVKPGTIVHLTDTQTMLASIGTGQSQDKSFIIRSVWRTEELGSLCVWYICRMEAMDHEELFLIAKVVGDVADLGIYFPIEGIDPDNRQGLIDDQEAFWLFQEPDNPDDLDPLELEYTTSFSLTMENDFDGEFDVEYVQTDVGPLQARTTYDPPEDGVTDHLATVVEFAADTDKTENTRAMILEIGEEDNEDGGLVTVLLGDLIAPDVEINIMTV